MHILSYLVLVVEVLGFKKKSALTQAEVSVRGPLNVDTSPSYGRAVITRGLILWIEALS